MERVQRQLGKRVRELRRATGYDQAAFATTAGFNRNWWGRLERGLQNVDLASLVRIGFVLDVSLSELVGGLDFDASDVPADRKGKSPGARVRRPPALDRTAPPVPDDPSA